MPRQKIESNSDPTFGAPYCLTVGFHANQQYFPDWGTTFISMPRSSM